MKTIKEFISESVGTSKSVNIIVGRFQPLTMGHLKCAEYVWDEYKTPTVLCCIETTKTDKKHPFKTDILWSSFNKLKQNREYIEDLVKVKSADIVKITDMLSSRGYSISYWTCGTDRYNTYKRMVDKYAPTIELVEIKRDDSDISASKVRNYITDNDIESFKENTPKEIHRLFDKFRDSMLKI